MVCGASWGMASGPEQEESSESEMRNVSPQTNIGPRDGEWRRALDLGVKGVVEEGS